MNTIEKIGGAIAIAVFLVGIGISWNSLNNRIDRVDEKIGEIQKALGSTACNSILTRQIEAIERGRADARKALEALSLQYKCAPAANDALAIDYLGMGENAALAVELNAVDALLNEGD